MRIGRPPGRNKRRTEANGKKYSTKEIGKKERTTVEEEAIPDKTMSEQRRLKAQELKQLTKLKSNFVQHLRASERRKALRKGTNQVKRQLQIGARKV